MILRLLKMRGGKVGRLDLIKLLFLTRENLAAQAQQAEGKKKPAQKFGKDKATGATLFDMEGF